MKLFTIEFSLSGTKQRARILAENSESAKNMLKSLFETIIYSSKVLAK